MIFSLNNRLPEFDSSKIITDSYEIKFLNSKNLLQGHRFSSIDKKLSIYILMDFQKQF